MGYQFELHKKDYTVGNFVDFINNINFWIFSCTILERISCTKNNLFINICIKIYSNLFVSYLKNKILMQLIFSTLSMM